MDDVAARICAGLCCLGTWSGFAGFAAWLARRRTRRVETELGHPASPGPEHAMLWYAGASAVWLSAAALAAVGLAKRERVRVGRDCLYILLGHFTVVTVATLIASPTGEAAPGDLVGPVLVAVSILAASSAFTFGFAWRWTALRLARLAAPAPAGDAGPYRRLDAEAAEPPGAWRFALYLAALALWPVGLVALLVFRHAHDAHVGTWAMRASMLQLLAISWGVCVGLGILVTVGI